MLYIQKTGEAMNNRNTIFFDLDGTLLSLSQEEFVNNYFKKLAIKLTPFGFEKDLLISSIWGGMKAMYANDGSRTNDKAFWEVFERLANTKREDIEDAFKDFYKNEFDGVKEILTDKVSHRSLIENLKEKGYALVLSTNPVFPIEAVETRLAWIDLKPEDFSYITTFDNSSYCKPKIGYYEEILEKINKKPGECIMIGNSVAEDMITEKLGFEVGLVTTHLENDQNADISRYPHGSLEEVASRLFGL